LCLEFFDNPNNDTLDNIIRNEYFAKLTATQQEQCRITRATDDTISIAPISNAAIGNAATSNVCGDYGRVTDGTGYFESFVNSSRYVFVSESYTGTYPIDFFQPHQISSIR
jgi:hypothetical protein